MQNIDTDQIIPAEYLTLVPSKVGAGGRGVGDGERLGLARGTVTGPGPWQGQVPSVVGGEQGHGPGLRGKGGTGMASASCVWHAPTCAAWEGVGQVGRWQWWGGGWGGIGRRFVTGSKAVR